MKSEYLAGTPVSYFLDTPAGKFNFNTYIGQTLEIHFTGNIFCTYCQRKTKKSYSQGYCFPCARKLARCDLCMVRPEICSYDTGGCREPEWADEHCMQTHIVYLANTSGLKVGVTRHPNRFIRWVDQGAATALPILEVSQRKEAGIIEALLSQNFNDKTNWRKMLQRHPDPLDLLPVKEEILNYLDCKVNWIKSTDPDYHFTYPVSCYPKTIRSLNPEKTPLISGSLHGIKGQYLIFDTGVLNMRKFAGYQVILPEQLPEISSQGRSEFNGKTCS